MEESHKTHRPHIKVGKDEEKKMVIIAIVAPSSDHYCFDTVGPSSDHGNTDTVPPSSDHYCTKKVALPSDQLILKERNKYYQKFRTSRTFAKNGTQEMASCNSPYFIAVLVLHGIAERGRYKDIQRLNIINPLSTSSSLCRGDRGQL